MKPGSMPNPLSVCQKQPISWNSVTWDLTLIGHPQLFKVALQADMYKLQRFKKVSLWSSLVGESGLLQQLSRHSIATDSPADAND